MRTPIVVSALLLCAAMTAAPCLAQTSAQFQACDKTAKTQFALDVCASNELALRNKQMQSVYSAILSHIAGQPATLTKVKSMQQAWRAYVAAYLVALYPAADKQAEYGTIYPMEVDLNQAALVQAHTRDLQGILLSLTRH